MTFASTDPGRARDFCINYLGAMNYGRSRIPKSDGKGVCGDIQWVLFPSAPLSARESKLFGREAAHFHFHFVANMRKPSGTMPLPAFERYSATLHASLPTCELFHEERVVLQAASLDPIISKLLADSIPFIAMHANEPGQQPLPRMKVALFVEIPGGNLVEIVGPTPQADVKLRSCDETAQLNASQHSASLRSQPHPFMPLGESREARVRPLRFVYAASAPREAARFAARYLHSDSPTPDSRVHSTVVSFRGFEMQWAQPPRETRDGSVGALEHYLARVHGNVSSASATDWDLYMDYHAGLLFEDCDPIIQQMKADGTPHFFARHNCPGAPHGECLSLFFSDHGGRVYEAMCRKYTLAATRNLARFNPCDVPSLRFGGRRANLVPPEHVGVGVGPTATSDWDKEMTTQASEESIREGAFLKTKMALLAMKGYIEKEMHRKRLIGSKGARVFGGILNHPFAFRGFRAVLSDARTKQVCFTGFGAGMSLLLALECNPSVKVLAFDMFPCRNESRSFRSDLLGWPGDDQHHQQRLALAYMQARYPQRRVALVKGDTTQTLPTFASSQQHRRCDVFMPLGGTDYTTKLADLTNGARLVRRGATLLIHDVDRPDIQRAVAEAAANGIIGKLECHNGEDNFLGGATSHGKGRLNVWCKGEYLSGHSQVSADDDPITDDGMSYQLAVQRLVAASKTASSEAAKYHVMRNFSALSEWCGTA